MITVTTTAPTSVGRQRTKPPDPVPGPRVGRWMKGAALTLLLAPAFVLLAGPAGAQEPVPGAGGSGWITPIHRCDWLAMDDPSFDGPELAGSAGPCTPEPGCGPVAEASLLWCPPGPSKPSDPPETPWPDSCFLTFAWPDDPCALLDAAPQSTFDGSTAAGFEVGR